MKNPFWRTNRVDQYIKDRPLMPFPTIVYRNALGNGPFVHLGCLATVRLILVDTPLTVCSECGRAWAQKDAPLPLEAEET